jgi:hypothetical protein
VIHTDDGPSQRTEQDGQATQTRAELEAELSAKEIQAAEAEADYRRLVAVGKAKLEHGIAQEDLWTYFCMARLCSGTVYYHPCSSSDMCVVRWGDTHSLRTQNSRRRGRGVQGVDDEVRSQAIPVQGADEHHPHCPRSCSQLSLSLARCTTRHQAKDSQLADFAFVKDLPWFKDMQQEASPPADPLEGAEQ